MIFFLECLIMLLIWSSFVFKNVGCCVFVVDIYIIIFMLLVWFFRVRKVIFVVVSGVWCFVIYLSIFIIDLCVFFCNLFVVVM